MAYYDQAGYDSRFDWGPDGARRLGPLCDTIVIVDIFSFSTAVDVAAARGATGLTSGWDDAAAFAKEDGAIIAVRRDSIDGEHPYSLSPASLTAIPAGTRLILPSPNGSAIALAAAGSKATVVTGCFRNSAALGTFIRR